MNLRNKPCSCGSGKKFKRCCGNYAERNRLHREAWTPEEEIGDTCQDLINNLQDKPKPKSIRANRTGMSSIALFSAVAMLGSTGRR